MTQFTTVKIQNDTDAIALLEKTSYVFRTQLFDGTTVYSYANTAQDLDREYRAKEIANEEMPAYADSWSYSSEDEIEKLLELDDDELIERYKENFDTLDFCCFK